MKIKQRPEDFQVEELTDVTPGADGPFALYRLEKRGWSTFDALAAVRRRWRIEPNRLSYGGLKDRHAHTIQYFTIFRGPERRLSHHQVHVEYLGQVRHAFAARDIRGNRFSLTLRALSLEEATAAAGRARRRADLGLPNYFDDQRFGSVISGGDFMARYWVLGQYEKALYTALTAPYDFDPAEEKRDKQVLRDHWGNWPACKQKLSRGHARSLISYLVDHPEDFRGALARLRADLGSLYLAAYQSHLWNRMLARWLEQRLRPEQIELVALHAGDLPSAKELDAQQLAELDALRLPLPSARLRLEGNDPRLALAKEVVAEEGMSLEQLKLKGVRAPFFSKGERAAWFRPTSLTADWGPDELNANRHCAILSFELPRGSYATLLVKACDPRRPS